MTQPNDAVSQTPQEYQPAELSFPDKLRGTAAYLMVNYAELTQSEASAIAGNIERAANELTVAQAQLEDERTRREQDALDAYR